ncbi:bZIP transcription factor [Sporobolomyces koalae]|uniref:bZIP transcription factor n=1 Tax=Sporobolomyces koalae TaxID=500713 RepID=UPI003176670C
MDKPALTNPGVPGLASPAYADVVSARGHGHQTMRCEPMITPGSPLFGATHQVLPDEFGHSAKDHADHFDPFVGKSLSLDILVIPLVPPLPLDDPLPLSSRRLSLKVLSTEPYECETDNAALSPSSDFSLFDDVPLGAMQQAFPPTPATFHHLIPPQPRRPSTASSSSSSFHHACARVTAFDQTLQSPLGLESHSASPQFSDDYWSPPPAPQYHPQHGDLAVSPLLLDNTASPAKEGRPCVTLFGTPASGLVSDYIASQASPSASTLAAFPDSCGPGTDRCARAFSPVMSQRTYENLLDACSTEGLAALPSPAPELDNLEAVENGEETDESMVQVKEDPEWIPSPGPSARSPRSSRGPLVSTPSAKSATAATTRRSNAPPVLPLDAPIQERKYRTVSRTSRKPIPQAVLRRHAKALESGEVAPQDLVDEATKRRRLNTLAARESRKRKAEAIEDMAKENCRLHADNEQLRDRVGELEHENRGLRNRINELERRS